MITKFKKQLLLLTGLCMSILSFGQSSSLVQTIHGRIVDEDSGLPLIGATIMVIDSDPLLGSTTDTEGYYTISKVPVGRVNLLIQYLGYEQKVIPNILLTSGKEAVINIGLRESLVKMDELVIKAEHEKGEVLNDMAYLSARSFTVEETKRYAGSLNDPARMVSAYAGVSGDAIGDNAIIVRGNSPNGIQWRLEGVEIPSPNHFSNEGDTGGSINVLNSNMLATSDFFTGAFAPQYGNVLSGLFDMNLRTGNNQKREYSASVGIIGTDVTLEGPFSSGYKGSYLVNYRYSSLSVLDNMGVVDFDGVPKYQDLSFKIELPAGKRSTFSLFGIGGDSHILGADYQDDEETLKSYESDFGSKMGVAGLRYTNILSDKLKFWTTVSAGYNSSTLYEDKFLDQNNPVSNYDMSLEKSNAKWLGRLQYKANARNKLLTGAQITRYNYNFLMYKLDDNIWTKELDEDGDAMLYQGFVSWKHRFTTRVSMVTGVHYLSVNINDHDVIEPRFSLRYELPKNQALTLGFGMHSKMHALTQYYSNYYDEEGNVSQPNTNLDFTHAVHYVVGYENQLTEKLHFKIEAYYQDLYDVPVEDDPTSSFSLLNEEGGFLDKKLVNEGTGKNYGVEVSLERFYNNHFYYLFTASVFDSKYEALDGKEYNTHYNNHYVTNLLIGKEFVFGRQDKPRTIGVNGRITMMGGRYYTPVDLEASIAGNEEVLIDDAWSKQWDPVMSFNLGITYRVDSKKISQELKLDLMNASNADTIIGEYYDEFNKSIDYDRQVSLIPNLYYKIYF